MVFAGFFSQVMVSILIFVIMNKTRTCILIDGSNFYYKLKEIGLQNLLTFNFKDFTKYLVKNSNLKFTKYYIGAIRTDRTEHSKTLFRNQRKLFAHLKKHNVTYILGYLLKYNNRYHEKGVDVNIAIDILIATYEDLCDHIILVSSDTDLLPAIKKAKEKGKFIEYIGFSE